MTRTERIRVWITTVDGASRSSSFRTPKGALAYISKWVGPPESAEGNKVVSFDGIAVARCSADILTLVKQAAPPAETFPTERDIRQAEELAERLNAEPADTNCCTGEPLEKTLARARDILEYWRLEAEYEYEMSKRLTRYD